MSGIRNGSNHWMLCLFEPGSLWVWVSLLAVREKAKFLVALLKDQERLKEERERAKQARSRLMQGHSGGGVSGDFGRTRK